MSPFMISVFIFAASLAAGTLLGAPALMAGMRLADGPRLTLWRAATAAFCATFLALAANCLALAVLDSPSQSLMGFGFFAAALAAGLASYVGVMRFSDVYMEKVPIVWAPYAALLVAILSVGRLEGWEFRESNGFYRGYENIWVHNMPETPEAMGHPEATVGYYNAQLKKLRRSAEETGMGHILTTFTHWDLKWLNENFQWICRVNAQSDTTGVERVIRDPRALKLLAVLAVARPIYGKVERSAILGREAIVKMDSGQLVRLHKEGDNWKIRDFLGMRPLLMQKIYDEKARNNALTDEDKAEAAVGYSTYESETKLLAQQIAIEYQPFYPFMADPEGMEPADRASAVLRSAQSSLIGGSSSENGKPKAVDLADLSYQMPPLPSVKPISMPMPMAMPVPMELPPLPALREQDLGNLDGATSHVPVLGEAQTERAMAAASITAPIEQATSSPVVTANAQETSESLSPVQAPVKAVVATDSSSSPTLPYQLRPSDVPIDTVWSFYFAALEKIERDDPAGVEEFLRTVSQEDAAWFRSNASVLIQLIAPRRADRLSFEQTQLKILKAMLRNMPHSPASRIELATKGGTAVAKFIETGKEGPQIYTTVLALEGSRWVMVHPFFARTFIWTPQLAWYKSGRGIPLTPEETAFLEKGYGPLQESVRAIYKSVGYSGGNPVVRHLAH